MGYAFEYDLQTIKIINHKLKSDWFRYVAMTIVLIMCTLAMHFSGSLFQTILLGNRENVKTAAEQMVTHIRDGSSLEDAVQTFYSELSE